MEQNEGGCTSGALAFNEELFLEFRRLCDPCDATDALLEAQYAMEKFAGLVDERLTKGSAPCISSKQIYVCFSMIGGTRAHRACSGAARGVSGVVPDSEKLLKYKVDILLEMCSV